MYYSSQVCYRHQDKDIYRILYYLSIPGIQPASHGVRGHLEEVSKGHWTVWIHTGSDKEGGTTDDVFMVVYGTLGQTDAKKINSGGELTAGSAVQLKVLLTCY